MKSDPNVPKCLLRISPPWARDGVLCAGVGEAGHTIRMAVWWHQVDKLNYRQ